LFKGESSFDYKNHEKMIKQNKISSFSVSAKRCQHAKKLQYRLQKVLIYWFNHSETNSLFGWRVSDNIKHRSHIQHFRGYINNIYTRWYVLIVMIYIFIFTNYFYSVRSFCFYLHHFNEIQNCL